MSRLMLLSSSRIHGFEFLEHAKDAIRSHLGGADELVFVPYAMADHNAYVELIRNALGDLCDVVGAHEIDTDQVRSARAIFVGGGNTFRLLGQLQERGLIDVIRKCVETGVPYIGSSAGTNVACPTIRTTNDMPIVEPASMNALGLVPFQINAHFVEGAISSTHMGETRELRLAEYLEENTGPVVALRESARLVREGDSLRLDGDGGAVLFDNDAVPKPIYRGDDLTHLLHS